ncbi:MAG: hypothetical protein QWI36_01385 [Wolbachia endosymbiont of Tyrophagus putrescentiae]|nr:hypothetical protein [Wolbachia endosymbiont of Tyrophagus putrescentiae]
MAVSKRVDFFFNHKIRRIISILASIVSITCRILLQFACDFINKNKASIKLIKSFVGNIRLPLTFLWIVHSWFLLQNLVKTYNSPKSEKEAVKIIGKSAAFVDDVVKLLIQVRVIHFLVGYDKNIVSYICLVSTVLLVFISMPISCYYSYKKYRSNEESDKYKKSLIMSVVILSIGFLNFLFNYLKIADVNVPIVLGSSVIFNFDLCVMIGIAYSTVFLVQQIDRYIEPAQKEHTPQDDDVDKLLDQQEFPGSHIDNVHHDNAEEQQVY